MAKKAARRRTKGSGSIYQRGGSGIWYAQYTKTLPDGNKVLVRESTGTADRQDAERFLRIWVSRANLERVEPAKDKRTVEDLYKLVTRDYAVRDQASAVSLEIPRWTRLGPVFGDLLATSVTDDMVLEYTANRKATGAKPSTINRELSLLRRGYTLGKITPPRIVKLSEADNVRQGFVTAEQAERIIEECSRYGLWMRALVTVLIEMGFRVGETLKMKVGQFDAAEGRISLPASTTKNKRAKFGYLDPETAKLVAALCDGKKPDDYLFTRENGKRVILFRAAWKSVTKRAGVPGILVHDLRRSAARLMRLAGVDRETIKKMAGWKTDLMYSRYSVDDDADLRDVVRKRQAAKQARIDSQLNHTKDSDEEKTSGTRVN